MPRPLNFRNPPVRRQPRARLKKARKLPSVELWTTDCETDPFHACEDATCLKCKGKGRVPEPFIWGAYAGDLDQYHEFNEPREVAEHFQNRKAVVYAHNGGKFDYHYLRDFINTDQPVMVINGRLAKFKIGRCEFRDSLNIFPNTRLKDFGIKDEIDYELMEPDKRDDPNVRAEIRKYLKQDCVGLWDMVARYRKEYGKKLTQAGASMKFWEKNHFKDDAPRQSQAQHNRYRPYYNGGRVQCFSSGVKDVSFRVADINSAYPFAMLHDHPIECEGEHRKRLPPDRVLHQCFVTLRGTARGSLPWRDPGDGELYFPDDEAGHRNRVRTFHITGWELQTALALDLLKIDKVLDVHMFWKRINFRDYIDHFFNLREEARIKGDVAGRTFGKYFMNSLYGKFGADPSRYNEYVIASHETYDAWKSGNNKINRGAPYHDYKRWGDRYLLEREIAPVQQRFYNVATAASVTGFVRAYLLRALHSARGLIYCDTDSVAAQSFGTGVEYGSKLGQWKHEGVFDRYAIAGKKLYAFHSEGADYAYDATDEKNPTWKVAGKGINLKDVEDPAALIATLATGGSVKVINQSPCYTITRDTPTFIHRTVKSTYKNVSLAPEELAA